MTKKETKSQADIEYQRAHCKQVKMLLHKQRDRDIITYLESQDNVQGLLKRLIREEIKRTE